MFKKKISRYDLYIGMNDKDTKTQLIETGKAMQEISNLATELFGGATISSANGVYQHDNGQMVEEPTVKVELLLFNRKDRTKINNFVDNLKTMFNQESIAVQHSRVESGLM